VIHHPNPEIYNEPGKSPKVKIVKEETSLSENIMTSPDNSIVMYRFELK